MELDRLWLDTRAVFRRLTGDESADVWLAQLRLVGIVGGDVVLTGSERSRCWVRARHLKSLGAAATEAHGSPLAVRLVEPAIADEIVSQTSNLPGSVAGLPADAVCARPFNGRYTFEQFVIGHGNRAAHAATLAVAEHPAQAFNPLFISGPPGLGKTHLLHSIGNYVARHAPDMEQLYMTAESFAVAFREGLTAGSIDEFKAHIRGADLLMVDDIQFLQNKARTEEEFFHTFNELMESGRQLVISSDRMPRELTELAERMRDRFESGLVVEIEPPDLALLKTILRKRVAVDGVELPDDEALDRIAVRVPANVRSLEGALIRVCALASLRRERVTADLVDEILDVVYPTNATRQRSVREIQRAVCEFFGLKLADLTSTSRDRRVTHPRQVAMYLACELTSDTMPMIASQFNRDHSTVIYARQKVSQAIGDKPDVSDAVDKLRGLFDSSTSDRHAA